MSAPPFFSSLSFIEVGSGFNISVLFWFQHSGFTKLKFSWLGLIVLEFGSVYMNSNSEGSVWFEPNLGWLFLNGLV